MERLYLEYKGIESTDRTLYDHVTACIFNIKKAIQIFGLATLAYSFNGGKDSVVLFHIIRLALYNMAVSRGVEGGVERERVVEEGLKEMTFVYFDPKGDSFKEMDDFIASMMEAHGIHLIVYSESGYLEGVKDMVERRGIKAFFMGTRRTDPHGSPLDVFSPSSEGWPAFMRVNCILDWSYCLIWSFIRTFKIPYCSLYDAGYTSIGKRSDSIPNPHLEIRNSLGHVVGYRAASELMDGSLERLSRAGKKKEKETKRVGALIMIGDRLGDIDTTSLLPPCSAVDGVPLVHVRLYEWGSMYEAEMRSMTDRYSVIYLTCSGPSISTPHDREDKESDLTLFQKLLEVGAHAADVKMAPSNMVLNPSIDTEGMTLPSTLPVGAKVVSWSNEVELPVVVVRNVCVVPPRCRLSGFQFPSTDTIVKSNL